MQNGLSKYYKSFSLRFSSPFKLFRWTVIAALKIPLSANFEKAQKFVTFKKIIFVNN